MKPFYLLLSLLILTACDPANSGKSPSGKPAVDANEGVICPAFQDDRFILALDSVFKSQDYTLIKKHTSTVHPTDRRGTVQYLENCIFSYEDEEGKGGVSMVVSSFSDAEACATFYKEKYISSIFKVIEPHIVAQLGDRLYEIHPRNQDFAGHIRALDAPARQVLGI